MIGYISIIYNNKDPATYGGVQFSTRILGTKRSNKSRILNTGDANYDYHCAMLIMESDGCLEVMGSSSCDHFLMDGGKIDTNEPGLIDRLKKYVKDNKLVLKK